MSLIVAGATGAVGRCVVREALRRAEFTQVVAITRSTAGAPSTAAAGATATASDVARLFGFRVSAEDEADAVTAAQLERLRLLTFDWELFCGFWAARRETLAGRAVPTPPYVGDSYEAAESYYTQVFGGHTHAAMCLGTTRRDAGGADAFMRCDFEYVVNFAEALRAFSGGTLSTYAQISSKGANDKSWFLYLRTKGRADAAVEALQFPRICIYRPGLLDRGAKSRSNERMVHWFMRGLSVEVVGRAVVSDFVLSGNRGSNTGVDTAPWECAGKEVKPPASAIAAESNTRVFHFSDEAIKKAAAALA